MRGKSLSSFVPSSFMELTFCMHLCDGHEDVSLRGLTKGNSSINNSSCYALKSITTFLTMAMLPHAAPQCLLHTTRTSSSGTPGGPTSPWMGSLGSRVLQQHCCTSTQAFFLPSLLYSGSDPHPPSSSVLVFSVSSCKGTNPTPGVAPS